MHAASAYRDVGVVGREGLLHEHHGRNRPPRSAQAGKDKLKNLAAATEVACAALRASSPHLSAPQAPPLWLVQEKVSLNYGLTCPYKYTGIGIGIPTARLLASPSLSLASQTVSGALAAQLFLHGFKMGHWEYRGSCKTLQFTVTILPKVQINGCKMQNSC